MKIEKENVTTKINSSEDIKEILCQQMIFLAEKSKECEAPNLHFNSNMLLEIGKYLNEHYFNH